MCPLTTNQKQERAYLDCRVFYLIERLLIDNSCAGTLVLIVPGDKHQALKLRQGSLTPQNAAYPGRKKKRSRGLSTPGMVQGFLICLRRYLS